jgi:hypothetical protein
VEDFRMTTRSPFRVLIVPFCSVALLTFIRPANAQNGWIVPGATGTPDESSATSVVFNDGGTVAVKSGATSARLRYPVVHTVGLDWYESEDHTVVLCMRAMMRDTGAGSRVVLKLQEVPAWPFSQPEAAGASVRTLLTIDSDTATDEATSGPLQGSADYRMAVSCTNTTGPVLFFGMNAYFVEATLTRSGSGNPGLKTMELGYEAY